MDRVRDIANLNPIFMMNHLFFSSTHLRALRTNLWYVACRRLRSGPAPRVGLAMLTRISVIRVQGGVLTVR